MQELWFGCKYLLLYFIVCASTALIARVRITIPDELFRKILHCILLGSLFVWVTCFNTWWMAAGSAIVFALVVYPCLMMAEHIKGYSQVVTERKSGELKSSLLVVFFMFAAVVTVCWGWFGDKMLALASVYAWGFGDAAAALIGKRFGKHKFANTAVFARMRKKDGSLEYDAKQRWLAPVCKKSIEGTGAMFFVSFVSVFVILLLRGGMEWYVLIPIAAVVAAVSAAVELFTPNGLDTCTCPLAAMSVLLPLVQVFGGI